MATATLFGRVAQAKHLGQLLEQEQRIRALLQTTGHAALIRADPRVAGCPQHYAHNWGNAAAKQCLDHWHARQQLVNRLIRSALAKARPSWQARR